MDRKKRKRLESSGWQVGSTTEFLGLSESEAALVELKALLALAVAERRRKRGMTQKELAKRIDSSQSRVAKIEAGDASVSLELLVRSFLAMDAGLNDLARTIEARRKARPTVTKRRRPNARFRGDAVTPAGEIRDADR